MESNLLPKIFIQLSELGGYMESVLNKLNEISMDLESELNTLVIALKDLPEGRISCEKQGAKYHFVKKQYINKERKRKNLSPEDPEVAGLIKRYLYSLQIKTLKNNLGLINSIKGKIKEFDFNYECYELIKKTPLITMDYISKCLSSNETSDWEKEPYEQLSYQNESTKWQISSFGMRFRSKSELLIAEALHRYNIAFHYEEILHFRDSMYAPDFTIKCPNGKIVYWEHEGLTNSTEYLNRQIKKSQVYASNGIVPWDNLIITYDNTEGVIDLRIVESEIKNKLLVSV